MRFYRPPTLPGEKNDSHLQKLETTKIHFVPTISKVGGDASHGSHKVVASETVLIYPQNADNSEKDRSKTENKSKIVL